MGGGGKLLTLSLWGMRREVVGVRASYDSPVSKLDSSFVQPSWSASTLRGLTGIVRV